MKQTFVYDTYSYDYYIEVGDRKSLTLIVRPDLRIIVRAPFDASADDIEAFLRRKWQWLEKRLQEFRKYQKGHHERKYASGESFYYLGRQYMLLVEPAKLDTVRLERGKLHVYTTKKVSDSEHNKKLVENWFSEKRNNVFKREYIYALRLFDYKPIPRLGQRAMARRWGSCTTDNKIVLNPKLIQAPREAIFYVCVHELCHVKNKKHDDEFYNELGNRIPKWREIKDRLEIRFG